MTRYNRPDDIRRIIEELEDEEGDGVFDFKDDIVDDPDDIDYEPEQIETDNHNSDSEEEMERGDDEEDVETAGDNFRFYIGKDGETLWASDSVAKNAKTKSKNIVKIFPGPEGDARRCITEFECFSQIISSGIIDNIIENTNIYKQIKKNIHSDSRERDYKLTNKPEILAFLGALFLLSVKRGNRTNLSEFFTANGTGFTILRANFSLNRFRFLMRSYDNVNTREQRVNNDKLAKYQQRKLLLQHESVFATAVVQKKNNRTSAVCQKCKRNVCKNHSTKEVTCHLCANEQEVYDENENMY